MYKIYTYILGKWNVYVVKFIDVLTTFITKCKELEEVGRRGTIINSWGMLPDKENMTESSGV
ncbi:MAG: hypothetical protein ACXWFX_14125 [Methylobacter sp.]